MIILILLSPAAHAGQPFDRGERRGLKVLARGWNEAVEAKTRAAFTRHARLRKPMRALRARLGSQRTRLLVAVEIGEIDRASSPRLWHIEKALEALDSSMYRGARYAMAIEHAQRAGIELPRGLREMLPEAGQLPLLHLALELSTLRAMDREIVGRRVARVVQYALAAFFGLGALGCLDQAGLTKAVAAPLGYLAYRFGRAAGENGTAIRRAKKRSLEGLCAFHGKTLDDNHGAELRALVKPDTP
jgi:hypothetical protein